MEYTAKWLRPLGGEAISTATLNVCVCVCVCVCNSFGVRTGEMKSPGLLPLNLLSQASSLITSFHGAQNSFSFPTIKPLQICPKSVFIKSPMSNRVSRN